MPFTVAELLEYANENKLEIKFIQPDPEKTSWRIRFTYKLEHHMELPISKIMMAWSMDEFKRYLLDDVMHSFRR